MHQLIPAFAGMTNINRIMMLKSILTLRVQGINLSTLDCAFQLILFSTSVSIFLTFFLLEWLPECLKFAQNK